MFKEKLYKDFISDDFYRTVAFNLKNWLARRNKVFGTKTAMFAIFDKVDDGTLDTEEEVFERAADVIWVLVDGDNQNRRFFTSQVYADNERVMHMDIVQTSPYDVELVGYDPEAVPHRRYGKDREIKPDEDLQDRLRNQPNKYKKSGELKRYYVDTKKRIDNLADALRKALPNASSNEIALAMSRARKYAAETKRNTDWLADEIRTGRMVYNMNGEPAFVRPEGFKPGMGKEKARKPRPRIGSMRVNPEDSNSLPKTESKKVIMNASSLGMIMEEINGRNASEMTFYAFNYAIRKFLSILLKDPVNAQPEDELRNRGFSRGKLIRILLSNGILQKDSKIVDTDEYGNPVTASMDIKFKVPREDFERKMKKLYIRLFERNLPEPPIEMDEDGAAGMGGATSANVSAAGQFSQPIFPMMRKVPYNGHKK